MRNKELDFNAMANATETSGRAAANEVRRGLLDGNGCQSLRCIAGYGVFGLALALLPLRQALADSDEQHRRILPSVIVSTTVPENGDLNPYGVAFVPKAFHRGDYSSQAIFWFQTSTTSGNVQGTGTTIIKLSPNGQVAPSGSASVFFQGTPPIGLTTALGVLERGFVLVGNVPTTNGGLPTQPGSLVDPGHQREHCARSLTKANLLDSPWDLTVQDAGNFAKVFVSNVVQWHDHAS